MALGGYRIKTFFMESSDTPAHKGNHLRGTATTKVDKSHVPVLPESLPLKTPHVMA